MAHDVQFSVPARKLGRSDVGFLVKNNDRVAGTLKVSNGSLVWFPKKTTRGHRMSWRKFGQLMEDYADGEERR